MIMNKNRSMLLTISAGILSMLFFTGGGNADKEISYLKALPLPPFEELHSPVAGNSNEFLILGNLRKTDVAKKVPKELALLAGRWEGYDQTPPVKNDLKMVLFVKEITREYITFILWNASSLQHALEFQEIRARVVTSEPYMFEAASVFFPGYNQTCTMRLTHDPVKNEITGIVERVDGGAIKPWVRGGEKLSFVVKRAENFIIYKDYTNYLNSKSIYTKEYARETLAASGKGYMYYLPENYDSQKKYPLLVFFHGMGDRGEDLEILAKASPFMYIREQEGLPMIIAAPLLRETRDRYFPLKYMEDFVAMMVSEYNVDESRIYITGLSIGGEAAWRFSLNNPDTLAALAVLCAPLHRDSRFGSGQTGFPTVDMPFSVLKGMPVRIIHGTDDAIVPPGGAEENFTDMQAAGADVTLHQLSGHDHDVWTTTYSDPEFYAWLLKQKRTSPVY